MAASCAVSSTAARALSSDVSASSLSGSPLSQASSGPGLGSTSWTTRNSSRQRTRSGLRLLASTWKASLARTATTPSSFPGFRCQRSGSWRRSSRRSPSTGSAHRQTSGSWMSIASGTSASRLAPMTACGSAASSSSLTSLRQRGSRCVCASMVAERHLSTSARSSCRTIVSAQPTASTGPLPPLTGNALEAVPLRSIGPAKRASRRLSSSVSSGAVTESGRCVPLARSMRGSQSVSRSPAPCPARWAPPRTASWRTRRSCP
mmetsp:Transcript_88441/g.286398  ORF Transcript_88441/g.286398 Transcript_88441/m.286398 type:complete len:262 (-) Transcript_88441:256-1041(-)